MKKLLLPLISLVGLLMIITMPSCQKGSPEPASKQITLVNPGFEDSLKGWTLETSYSGNYGLQASIDAAKTGKLGLNFYAPQPSHFPGAGQETPWNGKIYQSVKGLTDGVYRYKVFADAVGSGMYLWANGGMGDVKIKINSAVSELNTLEFTVKGGVAKIGFICIDANGNESPLSPYFHADNVELWTK